MASTENIITLTRQLLREESTSDVPVVTDAFLFEAIMDGQSKWDDAFQTGGENPIKDALEDGFDLIAETTLNEASGITPASTTITIDDDNADIEASNGAFIIWDDNIPDIIDYTTYTSATKIFSGVTGIAFDHEDAEPLQHLYKLPTNFGSFRESILYGDGVRLNGIGYRYMDSVPLDGFFSLYDNGTNKFLILPRTVTGSVGILFNKAYTTIDDLNDTVSVPEKHKFFLVYHCVSMCLLDISIDRYQVFQAKSEEILARALRNRNTGKKLRTRSFGRAVGDYVSVGGYTYPLYNG